jgi:hypothetical protein
MGRWEGERRGKERSGNHSTQQGREDGREDGRRKGGGREEEGRETTTYRFVRKGKGRSGREPLNPVCFSELKGGQLSLEEGGTYREVNFRSWPKMVGRVPLRGRFSSLLG